MPDVASRDEKVRVAVHLSKSQVIGFEDLTLNLMELWTGVT